MTSKFCALTQAAATYMDNHFETFWGSFNPSFSYLLTLFGSKHISLTRRTVDKHTLKSILGKHGCISRDRLEINVSVGMHRGKRCINKTFDFFHLISLYIIYVLYFHFSD